MEKGQTTVTAGLINEESIKPKYIPSHDQTHLESECILFACNIVATILWKFVMFADNVSVHVILLR